MRTPDWSGIYRAREQSGRAGGGGARQVSRYDPIELPDRARGRGELVLRLAGPLEAENRFYLPMAAQLSSHRGARAGSPRSPAKRVFCASAWDGAVAQRSLIASDGRQLHLRLFLQRGTMERGLIAGSVSISSPATAVAPLALMTTRWLEAVPGAVRVNFSRHHRAAFDFAQAEDHRFGFDVRAKPSPTSPLAKSAIRGRRLAAAPHGEGAHDVDAIHVTATSPACGASRTL